MSLKLEEKNLPISKPTSKLGLLWTICWRFGRIIGYLLTFVTILFFWWSFVGIAISLILYHITENPGWRRNWLFLAFIIGFNTLLVEAFYVYFVLLSGLIFGLYLITVFFISLVRWILKKIRKQSISKEAKTGRLVKKFPSKIRTGIKIALVIAPMLMWAVVSIDFGVAFNNNPHLLWVHAPSTVTTGETFSITIEAWDVYERLSSNYQGHVNFALRSFNLSTFVQINSNATLPSPYTFTGQALNLGGFPAYEIQDGKDNGQHVFSAQINTTGIHYILVNDTLTGNTYWSNPIIIQNYSNISRKIFWGDLHSHSILSDGSGTPEHSYYFARDVACLDFYALTDHGEDLSLWGLTDWLFGIEKDLTNQHYDPGNFVTFQGFEWTSHYPPSFLTDYGHYTCIFSGDSAPILASNYQQSPNDLWNLLDNFCNSTGAQALAMPHHTIRLQFIQDWTYVNPEYVKIAEATSVHGECLFGGTDPRNYRGSVDLPPEPVNGAAIIDAFRMGYQMVLYASGDNHDGHPGHSLSHTDAYIGHQYPYAIDASRNGHPYPSGLTAVYADNLTREGVFEALYNQRIFANSDYGRPIINFTINGKSVGDGLTVYVATNTTQRNISIFLAQDGAPVPGIATAASITPNWVPNWNVTIEVIKNGEIWNQTLITSPISQTELIDSSIITGTSYNEYIEVDGKSYINRFSDQSVDPLSLNTGGVDFYLIRIVGANGRTSYAGPIWIQSLT